MRVTARQYTFLRAVQQKKGAHFLAISFISLVAVGMLIRGRVLSQNELVLERPGVIGRVSFATGQSMRKHIKEVAWQDIKGGMPLYVGDVIRAGAASGLHWELSGGGELRLSELTTAELDKTGAQVQLRLKAGRIYAGDASTLIIKSAERTIKTQSASVVVRALPENGTRVTVLKGRATVYNGDRTTVLGPGQIAEFRKSGSPVVSTITVNADSPGESDLIASADTSTAVDLRWNLETPAIMTWEVATDPDFKSIVQTNQSHTGRALVRLSHGVYYWRIRNENGETVSPVARFGVLPFDVIALVYPGDANRLTLWRELTPIRFEWRVDGGDSVDLAQYSVELSNKKTFSSPVVRLDGHRVKGSNSFRAILSDKTSLRELAGKNDEWFWRVVALYPQSRMRAYSKPRSIKIQKLPSLPAPRLFFPETDQVKILEKTFMRFSWSSLAEAAEYQLFVWPARTPRPAQPTLVTSKNAVKVALARFMKSNVNAYHWTVVGVGSGGEIGGFGRKRLFRTFDASPLPAPKLASPEHGHQWIKKQGEDPIRFSWATLFGAERYMVTVERRMADERWQNVFSRTFTSHATKNELEWLPTDIGSYRWYVMAYDELGRPSLQSVFSEFEVLDPSNVELAAPAIISTDLGEM